LENSYYNVTYFPNHLFNVMVLSYIATTEFTEINYAYVIVDTDILNVLPNLVTIV
jgi:hypothetical protein